MVEDNSGVAASAPVGEMHVNDGSLSARFENPSRTSTSDDLGKGAPGRALIACCCWIVLGERRGWCTACGRRKRNLVQTWRGNDEQAARCRTGGIVR